MINLVHKVKYGDNNISFILEYKAIKNLNIRIKAEMDIYVSAPEGTDIEDIYYFVKSKGNWILKQLSTFKKTEPLQIIEKDFVSGESINILDKQYRLKVIDSNKDKIFLNSQFLEMYVPKESTTAYREKLYDNWVKTEASQIFNKALDNMYTLVEKKIKIKPTIEFRQMSKRWGSCLRESNVIMLNTALIKAPMQSIEYVVLHELIHFKYKNHDSKFYDMLTLLMPDWKRRKAILDEEVVLSL